jgi:hypothetical protein
VTRGHAASTRTRAACLAASAAAGSASSTPADRPPSSRSVSARASWPGSSARLLTSFGHTDVIDLGDISTARGPEMVLPLWLRLMNALGTPAFNIKIVR